jgi:hypothetical protein
VDPIVHTMAQRLAHHDLCFGSGLANVFGLGLEARHEGADRVVARSFVKQDHQGRPGPRTRACCSPRCTRRRRC